MVTRNIYIISFDNSTATVALEGNATFLYEHLITENNISLEVQSADLNVAQCIIFGDARLLKPGMIVHKTNGYLKLQFNASKIGKVVTPLMTVISDGIYPADKENIKDKNNKATDITIFPTPYSINDIALSNTLLLTGIKVIDFFVPITYGSKIGILGGAGVGKAQPLDAIIYTNSGPKRMGEIEVGDVILGTSSLIEVTSIHDQGKKDIYQIIFEDNRVVKCCKEHIWLIQENGVTAHKTLAEIMTADYSNIMVKLYPCMFDAYMVDINYVLLFGLKLSYLVIFESRLILISKQIHKSVFIKFQDLEIVKEDNEAWYLDSNKYDISKIKDITLKNLVYAKLSVRRILLSAIFNIDVAEFELEGRKATYAIDLSDYSDSIGSDLEQLILSVGCKSTFMDKICTLTIGDYSIGIKDIRYCGVELARCITVSSSDGLYATDNFIFTHNTTLMLEIIKSVDTTKSFNIFCGIGERIREGLELYHDFVSSGIIDPVYPSRSNTLLIYGNMDCDASIRQLAGRACVAVARHVIDNMKKNVFVIIDNIFRYNQASSEISTSLNQLQTERGYHPNIGSMMARIQEHLVSLSNGFSITSIQAIYVPADDNSDIGALTCTEYQTSIISLSRLLSSQQIYPAVCIDTSYSTNLKPEIVGTRHYQVYQLFMDMYQRYCEMKDLINIVGIDNLSLEDQRIVKRVLLVQSYMTQPMSVTKNFLDMDAEKVSIRVVVDEVESIINGDFDDFNEVDLKFKGSISSLKK